MSPAVHCSSLHKGLRREIVSRIPPKLDDQPSACAMAVSAAFAILPIPS